METLQAILEQLNHGDLDILIAASADELRSAAISAHDKVHLDECLGPTQSEWEKQRRIQMDLNQSI